MEDKEFNALKASIEGKLDSKERELLADSWHHLNEISLRKRLKDIVSELSAVCKLFIIKEKITYQNSRY